MDTTLPLERIRPGIVGLLAGLKILAGIVWLVFAALFAIASQAPDGGTALFTVLAVMTFGMSVLCFLAAYGLWTLKPYGRSIQIVLSAVGIVIGFPIGSVVSILILVYLFTPGIKILFSGRAPETLSPEEAGHLRASHKLGITTALIVGLAAAILLIPMIGIIAAIAIPNFLNAVDRGKQKRTIADVRTIAHAIDQYAGEHGAYPDADSVGALATALAPKYLPVMPSNDGWNRPFQVASTATAYTIYSFGKDGTGSTCEPAETITFNDEICLLDGQFIRYPAGLK